ncbi:ABC transporter permease subunit [Paenibacillus alkalitolerans]|uniref:ABC transporter permease subunit n=1 Tax=Paenibacillus alkalitolerans TaxID=2799335 RepID=UPI002D7F5DB3|nr:ABC transporter permease subunit [Paenibacillus alkalitolerans]
MLYTLRKYRALYIMIFPVLVYFFAFSYYPLVRGFVISFQQFRLIGDRPFVGWSNYAAVLKDPTFWKAMENTLAIGAGTLAAGFAASLIAALSLNEIAQSWFKKITQTIIYIPHLFSWVVVGGLWIVILSPDGGIVNELLLAFGLDKPVSFLATEQYGRWIMVFTSTWKEMGFTCIIFLAAIVGINPSLYEAARIDGANRWHCVRYVTLPQLVPTMKVVILLGVLGILRMFDQIFVMRNGAIAREVDVLMMYTYQKGILEFQIGLATAAGFLVIAASLIIAFIIRAIIRFDEG